MKNLKLVLTIIIGIITISEVAARPQPGDVYKEFWWDSLQIVRETGKKWYSIRVSEFYNPNNWQKPYPLTITDLEGARKAEVYVERAQVLSGTDGLAVKINENQWHPVPFPEAMESATDGEAHRQESVTFITIPIGLNEIKEGLNTIRLKVSLDGFSKAQNFCYGVCIRVYYDESKPHPVGKITRPAAGSDIGNLVKLSADAEYDPGIVRVDFIGHYEEYNFRNDGIYNQWQYIHFCDSLRRHIGSDWEGPEYNTYWNTVWIPDQPQPIKVCARIVGKDGTIYLTDAIENLTLKRQHSIELCKPYDASELWNTRKQSSPAEQNCKVDVIAAPGLANADSVKALWTSWGPTKYGDQWLVVNGKNVFQLVNVGLAFVYWDQYFPDANCDTRFSAKNTIKSGQNVIGFTKGNHHGLGISWPGVALKIRYNWDASMMTKSLNSQIHSDEKLVKITSGKGLPVCIEGNGLTQVQLISLDGRIQAFWSGKSNRVSLSTSTQRVVPGLYTIRAVGENGSMFENRVLVAF